MHTPSHLKRVGEESCTHILAYGGKRDGHGTLPLIAVITYRHLDGNMDKQHAGLSSVVFRRPHNEDNMHTPSHLKRVGDESCTRLR